MYSKGPWTPWVKGLVENLSIHLLETRFSLKPSATYFYFGKFPLPFQQKKSN